MMKAKQLKLLVSKAHKIEYKSTTVRQIESYLIRYAKLGFSNANLIIKDDDLKDRIVKAFNKSGISIYINNDSDMISFEWL